ncbi:hypothetical protein IWX91DRAFT_333218 [Phyllosticta citricarpa]
MADEKTRSSGESPREAAANATLPTVNPDAVQPEPPKPTFHPAVYIATWISLSSSVIVFNKWILDTAGFRYPIFLTTWHLTFATIMTQSLARFTSVLDSRKKVPMNGRVYLRAIVPIGIFFSLSLICGNQAYLYLSVAFIQMLKATTPVAVLLATWSLGVAPPNMRTLGNVSFIVIGVIIASFGEIKFNMTGFLYQAGGIAFEAVRLVMVQRLLSSAEFKMDPLVSLYYYAPACAIMNGVVCLFSELPRMTMADIWGVGAFTLLANALVAFLLNVSVVFLVSQETRRHNRGQIALTLCRLARLRPSSSPCPVSSRIFSSSLPRCSSSATPSPASRPLVTALPSAVSSTTSSVPRSSRSTLARAAAPGPSTARATPLFASSSSLASPSSSSSSSSAASLPTLRPSTTSTPRTSSVPSSARAPAVSPPTPTAPKGAFAGLELFKYLFGLYLEDGFSTHDRSRFTFTLFRQNEMKRPRLMNF